MALIFRKTPDTDGYFKDYEYIEVKLDNNHANIDTAVEMFKRFLLACGYSEQAINDYFGDET